MKWLSAGLTFLNLSTVCAVVFGLIARGLGPTTAVLSLAIGVAAAVIAFLTTYDPQPRRKRKVRVPPQPEMKLSKRAQRRLEKTAPESTPAPPPPADPRRYRSVWFWLLALCFAVFAVRSFCWLLYIDGPELKIQNANNLGDLALHITYIKTFSNGIALWPDNPIFPDSKLRYPVGVDLFNGVLNLAHFDLIRILVWTGLLASLATFYAMYRWGGKFGIAGFLFNGGLAGFQFLNTFQFLDYQGDRTIAWKSIPISMFVTQRGLLYAIPAGLILLWHWRETFFRQRAPAELDATSLRAGGSSEPEAGPVDSSGGGTASMGRAPLPFWVELSLYATMPLFHVHTFLALTFVAMFLFVAGDAKVRRHLILLISLAFVPATFFVFLITDDFRAGSVMKWWPGWVLHTQNDFTMPFFKFWWVNFGLWFPLVLVLLGWCGWRAWKNQSPIGWGKLPEEITFLSAAVAIFLFGLLIITAPWEWDNLKLMFWGYFLILPYLWKQLITLWAIPVRAAVLIALFGSGFVSLFGGLANPGFGFANRAELDGVGVGIRNIPVEARFASYPTYNHPVLLQGRKAVLGYPGHLWTQGFDNYGAMEAKLKSLMLGEANWQQTARELGARYMFWGREENTNYPASARPWARLSPKVATGEWGTIYDLGATPESH